MEADEENVGNVNLKRQRTPLSDSEDNVLSPSAVNDGQKRRRLEAAGQENCSPQASSSGRLAELEMKPDTPMVPSVRSRVQQFTQRREGGAPLAQRCLSDPGADSPSAIIYEKGLREHLLGEGEFHQLVERFKVPAFQAGPTPTPGLINPSPRTRSNFVSAIQQKLNDTPAASSKQVSRMRQEREQELKKFQFQPISENAWLKRSSSDPSLSQRWTPPGPSSPWPPRSIERANWPPSDIDGDAEMKDGSFTEAPKSGVEKQSMDGTDTEVSSHDETNTAEIIDQMFEEVLEYAGRIQDGVDDEEDHDSGIGVCSGDKDKLDTESEKEKSEEEGESKEEECNESKKLDSSRDELLSFPPSGILSPLSKSVEAVVTPLRLAASQESNPPSLLLTPEEITTPIAESAPLYSIDAYRTQRQSKQPTIQSVTPGVQRKAPEKSQPQPSVNTKEKIMALNEEAGKLQTVINQTLQALSCCTDEEHGRGSLEEAEAEKLLLVSCEKRSALLAEVARLREERNLESGEDRDCVSQQACRGTVSITNIQLPLKVEFVCSSHNRTGRPSHYFFILIRYGPCNIVATPLATAADAQNGDTISFPTSVTLKDIRASFEIDVEVYSLSHTSGNSSTMDRSTNKSRVTPRKLLNTITRSSNSLSSAAPSALNTRRSSNFCLVGSHKITLASLGHSKFPLDKVPFLSPLEGNIYLRLESESHSDVHHQGFLTMFELSSGYGVWQRRYFVLAGCNMYYWNYPNDRETKEAEGSISLSSSPGQCVRPVKRDSCARPFTFELASNLPQQQDTLTKCWFSADTKQERLDWMEKLNQILLDFHTWNRTSASQTENRQSNVSSSGSLRESIL
ncbi:LOW QUALITY PROTEIN: anillin, actin binding protein 2 [Centropristis striata]|uniref:LOW QUALITY PROTEIN: anillin, actin binding protein 2 n=1 Tax=Centropristis striata TaxID=184440 RepID=UPI0027DED3D9|nr:LOW QUALITY PROTEIN: anillin, actin binding protein 2 [Centropristis striata]